MGIFVDGGYCQQIEVAYDTSTNAEISYSLMKAQLGQAIVRDYNVTPDELRSKEGDVFAWASYLGDGEVRRGVEEFRERYSP